MRVLAVLLLLPNKVLLIHCAVFLGTDPEDVIRNAFACFDEEGTGHIHEDK